jgi:adenylate cyclase
MGHASGVLRRDTVSAVPSRRSVARVAGSDAVASLRRVLAEKAADVIRRDPDFAADAIEVGLLDRRWLEAPGQHPISSASGREVLQRFVERAVERRPSALGALGLSALQLLAYEGDVDGTGVTQCVTVVFTDLEGFTAFTSENGDEAAIALLTAHHRSVGPLVRSRGGRIVKRLGDGLMLTFPEPEAAATAALELLGTAPEPLRLRAGMHLGDAVVTHDDVVGHVVNVAARVTEEAEGGCVLATGAIRAAAEEAPGVVFGPPRFVELRGVPEPVAVCEVRAAG